MKLNVLKIHEDVILPTYATDGSGCFDIYADITQREYLCDTVVFEDSAVFSTGLKFEIPEGYVMLVFSRSGHGFKNNVRLANCVGVIDSDYRGELKVKLTKDSVYGDESRIHLVEKGSRIAQAMIIPIPKVEFVEVLELNDTARGEGGFGSTN